MDESTAHTDKPVRLDSPRLSEAGGQPGLMTRSAKAAIESGVSWFGHKHLAEYYQANGRMRKALEQLTLATKDPRINAPARAEIEARRKALEKLQGEINGTR